MRSDPEYRPRPAVVAVLNAKGGVGKTSTCHHLAGALAAARQAVVLVDNDPQASLTQGWLGPAEAEALHPLRTVAGVYGGQSAVGEVVRPLSVAGAHLVAGSWSLADRNTTRPPGGWPRHHELALREFVRDELPKLASAIRWCLIDCPPNLQLLSWAALVAADVLLVPVQAEDYGVQGLRAVDNFVALVRERLNPELPDPLYLVTMFDRRCRLPQAYEAELREIHGESVLETVVPRSVDFPESVLHRSPVTHHRPRSQAAEAMTRLAEELGRRVAVLASGRKEVAR